jgi:hypothetical protein
MIQIHNNVIDDGWQRAKNPTYGTPRRHPSQNGHIGFQKSVMAMILQHQFTIA